MHQATMTLAELQHYYGKQDAAVSLDSLLVYVPWADVVAALGAGEIVLQHNMPCQQPTSCARQVRLNG